MFLAIVIIYPLPEEESKVIDVLDSMSGLNAPNADCLGCFLSVEAAVKGRSLCYMERWRTWEALENHLRSPLYSRVLEAMELSCQPPMVEFFEVFPIGELELVEKARARVLNVGDVLA